MGRTSAKTGERYNCDECEQTFTRKNDVERHKGTAHSPPENPPKKIKCGRCEALFHSARNLRDHHTRVHTKELPHRCHACQARFNDHKPRNDHEMAAHGHKPGKKERDSLEKGTTVCDQCPIPATNDAGNNQRQDPQGYWKTQEEPQELTTDDAGNNPWQGLHEYPQMPEEFQELATDDSGNNPWQGLHEYAQMPEGFQELATNDAGNNQWQGLPEYAQMPEESQRLASSNHEEVMPANMPVAVTDAPSPVSGGDLAIWEPTYYFDIMGFMEIRDGNDQDTSIDANPAQTHV